MEGIWLVTSASRRIEAGYIRNEQYGARVAYSRVVHPGGRPALEPCGFERAHRLSWLTLSHLAQMLNMMIMLYRPFTALASDMVDPYL